MRKIYEYLTVEQKRAVVAELKADRLELQREVDQHIEVYREIVREVLLDTLDRWNLEINQLEDDIAHGRGAQS